MAMVRFKSGLIYAVVPCIWKDSRRTQEAKLRRILQIYFASARKVLITKPLVYLCVPSFDSIRCKWHEIWYESYAVGDNVLHFK